jgi:hypothetical protein
VSTFSLHVLQIARKTPLILSHTHTHIKERRERERAHKTADDNNNDNDDEIEDIVFFFFFFFFSVHVHATFALVFPNTHDVFVESSHAVHAETEHVGPDEPEIRLQLADGAFLCGVWKVSALAGAVLLERRDEKDELFDVRFGFVSRHFGVGGDTGEFIRTVEQS